MRRGGAGKECSREATPSLSAVRFSLSSLPAPYFFLPVCRYTTHTTTKKKTTTKIPQDSLTHTPPTLHPSSLQMGTPQTLPEYSDPTQLPSTPSTPHTIKENCDARERIVRKRSLQILRSIPSRFTSSHSHTLTSVSTPPPPPIPSLGICASVTQTHTHTPTCKNIHSSTSHPPPPPFMRTPMPFATQILLRK